MTENSRIITVVKGYDIVSSSSRGYVAPAGTPKEILEILGSAMKKAMADEEHTKRILSMGMLVNYMNPEEFGKYWEEQEALVKEAAPNGSSTARTASLSERFLGRDWRLGANPCSIAIPPSNPDGPVVLDMATSAVAAGKIEVAMARKEHVVPGWIIDKLSGIENILGKP